jgi:hypothetical protein
MSGEPFDEFDDRYEDDDTWLDDFDDRDETFDAAAESNLGLLLGGDEEEEDDEIAA